MYLESFGGIRIYRPRLATEREFRVEAERHLRSAYAVGTYTDGDTINSILHHQFAFFTSILEQLLPNLASRHFMEFLLFQYDEAAKVERLYKNEELNERGKDRWSKLGPVFRRAVKYMAERVVLLAPQEAPEVLDQKIFEATLDRVWICAEQMVKLYMLSDQTYLIYPDDTVFRVFPEGGRLYWSLELDIPYPLEMADRVRIDTLHRDRFVPSLSYETNHAEHEKVLAAPFRDTVGVSYEEALGVLRVLIEEAQPPDDGFSIPFIHLEPTVNNLSRHLGYPRESIEQVLAGFSISKNSMESESREVWKPKQEYRALRRGFFEFPHSLGEHLTWSKEMAKESAMLLMAGVVFKKLPPEWRSNLVDAALETLSNQAGKWFERIVQENLEKVSVLGVTSLKDGIGQTHQRIPIPPDVGEIDYLGYSPFEGLLVVLECKMVHGGLESKYFRDDISEFVTADTAYAKRFRKKIDWVRENVPSVCQALSSIREFSTPVNPNRVATAMITLYPTLASCFIDDFPCVTITELMLGYEANGKWPYEKGVATQH